MSKHRPSSNLPRALWTQASVPPIDWPYGQCRSHVNHYSRAAAKRAIREHLMIPCWKCDRGDRLSWFACPILGAKHYHIGHRRQRQEVAS